MKHWIRYIIFVSVFLLIPSLGRAGTIENYCTSYSQLPFNATFSFWQSGNFDSVTGDFAFGGSDNSMSGTIDMSSNPFQMTCYGLEYSFPNVAVTSDNTDVFFMLEGLPMTVDVYDLNYDSYCGVALSQLELFSMVDDCPAVTSAADGDYIMRIYPTDTYYGYAPIPLYKIGGKFYLEPPTVQEGLVLNYDENAHFISAWMLFLQAMIFFGLVFNTFIGYRRR